LTPVINAILARIVHAKYYAPLGQGRGAVDGSSRNYCNIKKGHLYIKIIRIGPGGEIGRRKGLKIPR
jgi:hypothetical protein